MPFSAKKVVKIQNFKYIKKVPLEILENPALSEFGPVRIKIVAGSLLEPRTHTHTKTHGRTFQYPSIPMYTLV